MKKIVLSLLALIVSSNTWADWYASRKAVVDSIYYEFIQGSDMEPYAVVLSPLIIEDGEDDEEDGEDGEIVLYEEVNEWGEIEKVTYYKGDIVIPSKVTFNETEYEVREIGEYAFFLEPMNGGGRMERGVSSVNIPNSVKRIDSNTFHNCTNLISIEIPPSVVYMGDEVFWGCFNLESVTLPNGITRIGNLFFAGCDNLKSITIPESVLEIGEEAFYGCSALTEVVIPNSVMKIQNNAFEFCSGLVSVVLSSKLSELGDKAFINCNALKKVTALCKRPTPITEDVFPRRSTQTLYVPAGYTSAYEQAEYWWQFKEIIEVDSQQGKIEGDVNGDGKVNVSDIMRIVNIILGTDN